MDRRPPLAVSPRRLRPRRAVPPRYPCAASVKKSPGTNSKRTQPFRSSVSGASLFRSESETISSELLSIAKNSNREEQFTREPLNFSETENNKENQLLFNPIAYNSNSNSIPLFEKGRNYDLYSAKRNERLKRRQIELMGESEVAIVSQNPAIAVELQKKRTSMKNEIARNSISGDSFVSRIPTLRFSVKTSKEMKKFGSLGLSNANVGFEEKISANVGTSVRRIGTRSSIKRY